MKTQETSKKLKEIPKTLRNGKKVKKIQKKNKKKLKEIPKSSTNGKKVKKIQPKPNLNLT